MKKVYTFAFAIIVLLLMAASVSANDYSYRYHNNYKAARAVFSDNNIFGYVDVYREDGGDTLFDLYIYGYDANGQAFYYESIGTLEPQLMTIPSTDFKISDKSAILDIDQLEVMDLKQCKPVTISIKVDWSAKGNEEQISNERIIFENGIYKGVINRVPATATISINGKNLSLNQINAEIIKQNFIQVEY